jgi:hypothetical protein
MATLGCHGGGADEEENRPNQSSSIRVYAAEIGGVRRFWGGTRQNFVYALESRSEPGARCCVLSLRGVVHSGAQCCALWSAVLPVGSAV